jgi:hypothetical protein
MQIISKLTLLVLLFISSFILSCCKDECEGKSPTSANFKIFEILDEDLKFTEDNDKDTVYTTFITFLAQDSTVGNSYEWQIGSDQRTFTKREVTLDFKDAGEVIIRLIVKNNTTPCFPSDDGIDTLIKTIYVTKTLPWVGKFEGYVESKPSEKFVISTEEDINRRPGYYLNNLPNGCLRDNETYHKQQIFGNYKNIKFGQVELIRTQGSDIATCQLPWGIGKYNNVDKKLILDYKIWSPQQKKFINDRFVGVKK